MRTNNQKRDERGGTNEMPTATVMPGTDQAPTAAQTNRTQTTAIIEAVDVVKQYSSGDTQVTALRGVSLTVNRGEIVAVMGPSGCGKTTLLNTLSGLDRIDGGVIRVDGVDLATLNERKKTSYRAQHMGFIFQTYNLLPVLSSVENVELPLVVSGVSAGKARARAMAALERVGLAGRANNYPAQLSGGQRQRVTIARALVNDPAIVWADEPTGALDSTNANDILTLVETLNREQSQTFVIVTHDPGVGRRCHRTVRMNDGQIVGEETN
jgi:putative ABC transport system ATP-binding protein